MNKLQHKLSNLNILTDYSPKSELKLRQIKKLENVYNAVVRRFSQACAETL